MPENASESTWLVALGAGGEIIATERGAPASWRGARVEERSDVPASLRDAAQKALDAWRASPTRVTQTVVEVPELGVSVRLVVLPAVGILRAPCDLRALFASALAPLDRQACALDVTLSVETSARVPALLDLDPEKTAWAVTTVVGNALRHVKRGTRMRPGGAISLDADLEGRDLVITVSDDGPGVPPEILAHLFQRAPGAPHAGGLALLVVRDVIRAHGGSVDVASSTDPETHGTTVTLRLPAA